MDAVGTVLSLAQTLFAALQCSELKELCSFVGYKSELENLERTLCTIKAVLLDAESKQELELSLQQELWIEELKDVVYDADDLLDKLVTLAEQKQLIKDGNVSRKVWLFFSHFNPLITAQNFSQGVKEIRSKLDAIASNHSQFGFKLDCEPIRRRREETCSYVYAQNIIGRDDDMEKILAILLDANVQRDVSFLSIVGLGGLGKTALAQLLYNHPRIEKEFPLRLWTCVSDQDQKDLDMKAILVKILESATRKKHKDLGMDDLQRKLQDQLAKKKYFLVLDDVWSEDRHQWLKLADFLMGGLRGSWIIVTTRSGITAQVVGDGATHELKGLQEKDSWCLFQRTAFGQGCEQSNPSELVQIGQEIVKQCANVPLALIVVGSLLYGHDKEKWLLLQDVGMGKIKGGEKSGIKPILKLSYHHLESPFKVCFSYFAIFPKDYEMKKEMLISLWMAQGYIVPLEKGQSVEDAAEEYFSILLKRCFFQDVKKDEYGEIASCKIHDLMHDIAQEVAGKEIYATNSVTSKLDKKVRHLYHLASAEGAESSFAGTKIRTYLQDGKRARSYVPAGEGGLTTIYNQMCNALVEKALRTPPALGALLTNWMNLRVLDLSNLSIKSLPSTLGNLLHLRYLDLSQNCMELLPKSITKLHNLQTLKLQWCKELKELPKGLTKLIKLRILDITSCRGLNGMPWGMGKLSCLQKLTMFIVDDTNLKSKQYVADQLKDLKALKNLKGHLDIQIKILENTEYENAGQGGYLCKQHLSHISIQFPVKATESKRIEENEEALLEDLQPHLNLREFKLVGYSGKRMPSWATEDNLATFLPNLVKIYIEKCGRLQHLASLGKLHHLKSLEVVNLSDLEFVEDTISTSSINVTGSSESLSFFPSLQQLKLQNLSKLKGWWRDDGTTDNSTTKQELYLLPSFPHLSSLYISGCRNLTCIPLCPSVEKLNIWNCNEKLKIVLNTESGDSKIRAVFASNVGCLQSILPIEPFNFQSLELMSILGDEEAESLAEARAMFQSCSSSLRSLEISSCPKLKSLYGGLEHLTALENLHIHNLPNLNLTNAEEGEGKAGKDGEMPWPYLHQNLRSLSLEGLPKLVSLPKGLHYLTALQSLHISYCERLESVSESIRELTSLQQHNIWNCSFNLKER